MEIKVAHPKVQLPTPILKMDWRLRKSRKPFADKVVEILIYTGGFSSIVLIFAIHFFILKEAYPFLVSSFDVKDFFMSEDWNPASVSKITYGILALVVGTLSVTLLSMMMAVPLGLACAFYISEFCSPGLREIYKILIEALAAIPSVV